MAARPFRKGYLPNWSTKLFTINARIPRYPPVYTLNDYQGEQLEGTFYEQELQHAVQRDDLYKVEKRRRGNPEYLVKWVGYPEKFNSWVSKLSNRDHYTKHFFRGVCSPAINFPSNKETFTRAGLIISILQQAGLSFIE